MRFATRVFLWSFLPFAILLTCAFWSLQRMTASSVRQEIRSSLRNTQLSISNLQARAERQINRSLRIVGDNAPLKAGLELIAIEPASADARRTVEDQLRELCAALGFDFLIASGPGGEPLAGVMRMGERLAPLDLAQTRPPQHGFYTTGAITYQVTSVAVDHDDEHLGVLTVGERFELSDFNTPAVLTHRGKVLKSNVAGIAPEQVEAALRNCGEQQECELRLSGQNYLSLPLQITYFGDGYVLRSLQNEDAATGPIQSILLKAYAIAGAGALSAALILSFVFSRSIVKPLGAVVRHLRESSRSGSLPEFQSAPAGIHEIRQLTDSFNHAAASIREAQNMLRRANIEFVRSLASALDARDCYTAGHSRRVSESACAIGEAMHLPGPLMDELRIGALLHDIGKIGISDTVLQKAGALSSEEFDIIKQHPVIGRTILEGVNGFQAYLPIVELHHENWDGTGYPHGLAGEAVPLTARIVHVVDAFDAMTSDRPYRLGMRHEVALETLRLCAGTQFDPHIVAVFARLQLNRGEGADVIADTTGSSLRSLAAAVATRAFAEIEEPKTI